MKPKKLLIPSLLILISLLIAACGAPAAEHQAPSAAQVPAATDASAATQPEAAAPVTLTYLVDDSQANQDTARALADAYMALHPNVTINVELRPGGTEGDNLACSTMWKSQERNSSSRTFTFTAALLRSAASCLS